MKLLFQLKSIIQVDTDTLITTNDPFQSEFFKTIEFVLQQDQEKRQFELTSVYRALHDKTEALTRSEAIAISVVKWALCQVEPTVKGANALALLPKKKWWRLFIDQHYQEGYEPGSANDVAWALRFDLDQSPGFFNALMSLYEDVLAPLDPKLPLKELTPEIYKSYHRRVTNKGLAALSPKFYAQVESDWSGYGVSFGMDNLVRKAPDPQALVELIQVQELGLSWQNYQDILKDKFPDGITEEDRHALSLAAKTMHAVVEMKKLVAPPQEAKAPEAFNTFLDVKVDPEKKVTHYSVIVNYPKVKGPTITQQCFDTCYLEQKSASSVLGKQRAIVKCIRSLHVAHLFPDANGRLNILLLLNFFLLQAGFSPVILRDPAVFGGALTLDELLQEIERGEGTFNLAAKRESK